MRSLGSQTFVLIPRYKEKITFVDFGLEEMEREEFYRLKRVQKKNKDMEELEEQQRLARLAAPETAKVVDADCVLDDSTDDSALLF
jgi:V-type H+-transporting ATPase subunit D